MSDDEKFQIIGKVVHDHEARKRQLAALDVKAKTLAEFINTVANILTGTAKVYRFEVAQEIVVGPYNQARGGSGIWPTYDGLSALMHDIETTRAEIADLERQRKELGV